MTEPAGLQAALQQGTRNAERITALETALAGAQAKLSELRATVQAVQGTVTDQGEVLRTVDGLKDTVDELLLRVTSLFPDDTTSGRLYTPIPTPRFWQLTGDDREQAVDRLRSWVHNVYLPAFGHLAATLPSCWDQHPLCLTALDVASELHSLLYLQPTRNQGLLAGQAELLTRLLPALAALIQREAARCQHTPPRNRSAIAGALS